MNKFLFKWHSRLAIFAFIPLLVICVTGAILVFKHEIDTLLMEDKVRVATVGEERLSMDLLRERVHAAAPEHEITGWALFQDPGRADLVYLIPHGSSDWFYLLLDQYSGEILAPPRSTTHYLTDWLLELHFTFLLSDAGMAASAVFAVVLCLLGLSGLILHRRFWGNLFRVRWKARRVVAFSDLHKMVGVIASPILLILGVTGAWWNISELMHEYEEHQSGAEHHVMTGRLYNEAVSLDSLLARSRQRVQGFDTTYISLPWEPERPITLYGDVPDSNALMSQYASYVSFDAQDGERLAEQDIRQAGLGVKALDSFRRLHFGDFGGLASRILWALVGMMPLVLAVTGVTLWATRRRKMKRAAENKRRRLARLATEQPGT